MIETVACRFCGEQTEYTGTRECINCHETVIRLKKFLRSKKARVHTLAAFYRVYQEEDDDSH